MKFLPFFLLIFALPAAAAKPLHAAKTIQVGKRTLTVEERGNTLFVRAPDYELSLRDTDSDKFYDEKVVRRGALEMRFFHGRSGVFANLEIRERKKDGVHRSLYYRDGKAYRLLEAQFRPHKILRQELSVPVRGHYYQVCRDEIRSYAEQVNTDWLKIIGALNETEMYGYLRSMDIVDPSCNTGAFKGSYEHILRAMASVLATYKMPGAESRYLGCLEQRKLSGLADTLLENLVGKGENQVRIRCENRRRTSEETTGSYNSRSHAITFYEPYEADNPPEVAKKLYARTFFHEAIHACGMDNETHVHELEGCCSDDQPGATKPSCDAADAITAKEHRLVSYASAFAKYLPGFGDFWRELVSFKDTQAEKDIFDHFILGAQKVFDGEKENFNTCEARLRESETTGELDLRPCFEQSYKNSFRGMSGVLNEVCETYFAGAALPDKMRKSYQARCQSFRFKLAEMLKAGYETECSFGTQQEETDRCVTVAMDEARKNTQENVNHAETYEKLAMARQSDEMRYFNSLYLGIEKNAPGLEEFRLKLLKLLRDEYPKGRGDLNEAEQLRRAERAALEQQSLFFYRYLDLLDKSFPRSEAGSLGFECRGRMARDKLECERQRVERVNTIFFQYFCPTTITVTNQLQVCGELRKGIDAVWDEVLDRCPHKDNPTKSYQCYQNVVSDAVSLFADSRVREPPAFGMAFLDSKKLEKSEARLMEDFELTDVERAYLGAVYRMPGGRDFFEQAVTDVDTGSARRILQYYVRFLRARELEREEEGEGKTAERYEACLRDVMSNFGKNEDCDESFLTEIQDDTKTFFGKWCGLLVQSDGNDSCSLMHDMTEKFLAKASTADCDGEGGRKGKNQAPSFQCIQQAFQVAEATAQNMSRNFFTWDRVRPLRRSKENMKLLVARLSDTEESAPGVEFGGSEKPEARVPIDFSDYDRMRKVVLDAEDQAGPLAEMGKKVVEEVAKLGVSEAYAGESYEDSSGSSFSEGRRVYGSEAQPWLSRVGDEYIAQEEYRRHQAMEPLDSDGIVKDPVKKADASLPAPPTLGSESKAVASGAASGVPSRPAASRAKGQTAKKQVPAEAASASASAPAKARASSGGAGGGRALASTQAGGAKLSARGQGTKPAPSAQFTGDRGPATRAKAVDAATVRFGRPELLELAKKNPAVFLTKLDDEDFLAALKFHRILVIVNDKAYGSLSSATILRYDDGKGSFDSLRLGDEE